LKHILGKDLYINDIEEIYSDIFVNLKYILENDVEDIGPFYFTIEENIFGQIVEYELK
jgi:hypothetical protein